MARNPDRLFKRETSKDPASLTQETGRKNKRATEGGRTIEGRTSEGRAARNRSTESTRGQASSHDLIQESPHGLNSVREAHAARTAEKTKKAPLKEHKPGFFARTINGWFNRIIGAAVDGSFSKQEALYAAHHTRRDYTWNTIAIAAWGFMFPLLTIVATQLVGVEQAGMFSMALVVGTLLMFVGNYGVRTYQVSDIKEAHSFSDYQIHRWLTCIIMVVAGLLYCVARGYAENMFAISMGVYVYKMIDGLADVYEGRLQQMDKLYLAGVSLALRSVLVIVVFSVCLLITKNLVIACIAMAIVAAVCFVLVTFPLALLETPKSRKRSLVSIKELFVQCFPLFIALFAYALIDAMPKLIMEGTLTYDNQLYFNVMCLPAAAILLIVGLVYKPQLLRMANLWADPRLHRQFDLMVLVVILVVVVLSGSVIFIMATVGITFFSFVYNVDFERFRELFFVMVIAGGITAIIDFLYQVITVLRKQAAVMKLYIITFGFAAFIPVLLISFTELPGAVMSYLIVMSILLVLLVMEFFRIRYSFSRELATQRAEETRRKRRDELEAGTYADNYAAAQEKRAQRERRMNKRNE
jgi:O-antigen/teichoic acid export membrane protein